MPQDQYKNDKKFTKFPPRPNDNGENNTPRKGPKFSIYWIYAIIFAVLIGFQFWNSTSSTADINQTSFTDMLANGEVAKYTIISNRNLVRVKLKPEAIQKEEGK